MKTNFLKLMIFFPIFLTLSFSNVFAASNATEQQVSKSVEKKLNEQEALDFFIAKIKKDKLYDSWTNESCLSFLIATDDPNDLPGSDKENYFYISIYEKHGGKCPGDPNTAPLVDIFGMDRFTKELIWLDRTDLTYYPYGDALKAKQQN